MMLTIDVIVRTLADSFRSEMLFRALDSIQNQHGITARPIVVVNGESYDQRTLNALRNRPGIRFHYQQLASAGLAFKAGCRLVTAPFFAFLDDDDVFVEDVLLKPVMWFENNPQCDVVVTNRYYVKDNGPVIEFACLADHAVQPVLSLLDENWLSAGTGFFRTSTTIPAFMSVDKGHQEWTHLAYRLCTEGRQLHFMDVPTALVYDTPGSMSKKMVHQEAALDLLQLIRHDSRMDILVHKKAEFKYRNALHVLAMNYWRLGDHKRAWCCHLASLRPPHTFKYIFFTRKLLWPFGTS